MRTGLFTTLTLVLLTACDAGPPAVMPDGASQAPTKPQVTAGKPVPSENPAEEASMPIEGEAAYGSAAAPVDHTLAPSYGKPLPLPKGARAAITET